MKLLVETVSDVKYLTEEDNGKKVLHIEGIFLQAEQKNRNGRVYPRSILEREVNKYLKEKVETGRSWGELGHPDTPSINLDRACHRIISLKAEGNNWVGKSRILETPHGNIVRALIEDGGQIGVSSRGMGTLKMVEGTNMVQDDYYLATAADVVADPSAPDAFVRGLMEQKEWVWDNGIIKEATINDMRREVKKASSRQLEEVVLREFQKFINCL